MPVPCAALNALLFLSALRLIVSAPLLRLLLCGSRLALSALLLIRLLPLLLSMLLLPILLRLLSLLLCRSRLLLSALLLSGLLPLLWLSVRLLPTLLRLLLSLLLCGSRLLLSALLLSRLRSLLGLGVRLLPLLRLLSMLLCGLLLRGLGLLLFGMVLFFAFVLCIGRARDSEKQRQHCRADDSSYFHKFASSSSKPRSVTRYEGESALVIGFRPFFL